MLRTVRSVAETPFVPHVAVTGAVVLALLCVGTLVWFVHHVATGIIVETVIDGVHEELRAAVRRLTTDGPPARADGPPPRGATLRARDGGYLRTLDEARLADWAAERDATVSVLVRPGDYVFPGAPVATVAPPHLAGDAQPEVRAALSLGARQAAEQDLEFSVRQLVEVAVRALSPGVNDPFTACAVLDRLGATLAALASRHLPGCVIERGGRTVLHRRIIDYEGLCDAMFHLIRQNAAGSAAVLIRLIEVLTAVLAIEHDAGRRAVLRRHAERALAAGRESLRDAAGLADLTARHEAFDRTFRNAGAC